MGRYFYTIGNEAPKPLVYKKYFIGDSHVGTNESYKIQLKSAFTSCTSNKDFDNINYKLKSLKSLFKTYNICKGSAVMNYTQTPEQLKEKNIKLKLKVGGRKNELSLITNNQIVAFPSSISLQFGLEGEFIFNFNRNKWSAMVDFNYFSYQENITFQENNTITDLALDYSGIEASIGARYSMFVNNNSRVFITGYYIVPFNLKETLESNSPSLNSQNDFLNLSSFGFGLGYEYNKISLELKYIASRSLIKIDKSKYESIAVIFGFSFL